MEPDKSKTYYDVTLRPIQPIRFIGKIEDIYRFARVSDNPATDGSTLDFSKADLIFLKET